MALQLARRLFTTQEYHRMAEAGILHEDDRIELIDGEIVEMSPIGWRHAAVVTLVSDAFYRVLGDVALVSTQNPVGLSDISEPQPDVTLLRRNPSLYTEGHPGPSDTLVVVEVADSSEPYDRRVKLPLYARSGIPEAWLVDLNRERITVYRDPEPAGYRSSQTHQRGEQLSLAAFPDRVLHVTEILG